MTRLSVIILTRDRLGRLRHCLGELLPQLGPGDEVILLDTGSTDGTRAHFEGGNFRHAAVRFIRHEQGGSWAEMRNAAVGHATGDIIAFLDDDCIPAPDWVARGRDGLADADAVGGIVRPLGIQVFPRWWHPEMGWMVGLSVPGHAGLDAGRTHYPMTSNLWARAEVCRTVPFQEIGGALGGAEAMRYEAGREDAQWWRALRTGGWRVRFDPALGVNHAIDPLRLNLRYLRERADRDGRAWARREGVRADLRPTAYGWWDHAWHQAGALFGEDLTRSCDWHFHRLSRRRQGQALRTLAERLVWGQWIPPLIRMQPALWAGGLAYARDRAKTALRRLASPRLISRPVDPSIGYPLERMVVVAFGYLGDLVILQSALRGLAQDNPQTTIHVLAPAHVAPALGRVPRMIVASPPEELTPGSRRAVEWLEQWLLDVEPDAIVAPYLHEPWGRTLTALRHPPRPVIGFDNDTGLARQWQLERLTLRVHKDLEFHEVENLALLFHSIEVPCRPLPARLDPEATALEGVRRNPWFARHGGAGVVMLNPDAGHPQKEWTDPAWATLAGRILRETSCAVAINATRPRPGLEQALDALALDSDAFRRILWLRGVPLNELIAWLALSRGLITVDAGPQHLAHALSVPSVTLYGPMDERRWMDWWRRPQHRTVRACAWDLTPEERRALAPNHQVALIAPDAVYHEWTSLLEHPIHAVV